MNQTMKEKNSQALFNRLQRLAELPEGWGNNYLPIHSGAIENTRQLLTNLKAAMPSAISFLVPDDLTPTGWGTVTIRWEYELTRIKRMLGPEISVEVGYNGLGWYERRLDELDDVTFVDDWHKDSDDFVSIDPQAIPVLIQALGRFFRVGKYINPETK